MRAAGFTIRATGSCNGGWRRCGAQDDAAGAFAVLQIGALQRELQRLLTADRVEQATTLPIRRITHSWAGLRSFAPDELPVVGEAADTPGFFWCAGQGGAGFQTAPALSAIAAAAALGLPFPEDAAAAGLSFETFAPARFNA